MTRAFVLDGNGGGKETTAAEALAGGFCWVHLDLNDASAMNWLTAESGLDPLMVAALSSEETRPRAFAQDDTTLLILRGINLNPGEDPEDMVSIRVLATGTRIISAGYRHLLALDDLRADLQRGAGFRTSGGFFVRLTQALTERIADALEDLDGETATIEERMLQRHNGNSHPVHTAALAVRRSAVTFRRWLGPQREALLRLEHVDTDWLEPRHRAQIHELAERASHTLEFLDWVRDRVAVIDEELRNQLNLRMNRAIYLLTIVSTIVLPLNLVTGMLGTNIGGIPGANNPHAFTLLTAGLAALAAALALFFIIRRRSK